MKNIFKKYRIYTWDCIRIIWSWNQIFCFKWNFKRIKSITPPFHHNCRCLNGLNYELCYIDDYNNIEEQLNEKEKL